MNEKFLLLFPPLWSFTSPHLALPSLSAQLKHNGFKTKIIDLNILFYEFLLKKEQIDQSIEIAKNDYQELKIEKIKCNHEDTLLNYKYSILDKMFKNNINLNSISQNIETALFIIKNSKLFYNYKLLLKAEYIIQQSIQISSLPYLPSIINNKFNYQNNFMKYNIENIQKIVCDKKQNIFLNFYKKYLDLIEKFNYEYIGISISADSQLIGGLTLAKLLKEKTNAHINIGGNFFSGTINRLYRNPDFFNIFADSVSYNEGENSIVKLAKYINKEIKIEEVPNLIYKINNQVRINPIDKPVCLSKISLPDFSDLDLKKYFSPEIILPMQINRGCYWNKCTFCNHSKGKTYTIKPMEKLIQEIKQNEEKYNAVYYNIIDEAIPPQFLDRFCDELIKNDIKIKFKICARFEAEFSYKLLKKAHKAGLRLIQWGFETGNKRIHNLINKGVKFENRLNILKNANKAGIVNYVFALYGIPTETYKEANDTLCYIKKYHKYIQIPQLSCFCLLPDSIIAENPYKFKIFIEEKQEPFSCIINYTETNGMTKKEKEEIRNKYNEIIKKYYSKSIFYNLFFSENEQILLYNTKYNLSLLKEIKSKN